MSKVIDVAPTENVAPVEISQPSSFAELRKSWTPEQQREWDSTGKEPETPTAAAVVPTKQPEPETVKVEPASGAGEEDQDHEPEYFGTPDQQKAQRHAFAKLKRERAEARAEAKILREQLAGKSTPAAPAAALKVDPKPQAGRIEQPELPDISDEKYNGEDGSKKYHADLKEFHRLDKLFDRQEAADQRAAEESQHARRSRAELWASELTQAKEAHADFEAVAFSPKTPASLPMIGVLTGMKGGAELCYYLGNHPEIAQELAALTDISGPYQTYEELADAARTNPSLHIELRIAEGVVRAEIRRIQAGLSKDPTPKPITVTRATAPAEKVSASASVTKDPIAEAWKQYDLTGDHKYLTLANRLEDERDKAARTRS